MIFNNPYINFRISDQFLAQVNFKFWRNSMTKFVIKEYFAVFFLQILNKIQKNFYYMNEYYKNHDLELLGLRVEKNKLLVIFGYSNQQHVNMFP